MIGGSGPGRRLDEADQVSTADQVACEILGHAVSSTLVPSARDSAISVPEQGENSQGVERHQFTSKTIARKSNGFRKYDTKHKEVIDLRHGRRSEDRQGRSVSK
jgi:hypothetical protein